MNPWSNALWLNEHGPRGGDEINIPQKGKNYGWPLDLTDDGRILVTDGYAQQGGYATDGYALVDADDYLAGSTDYQPVQMWEE